MPSKQRTLYTYSRAVQKGTKKIVLQSAILYLAIHTSFVEKNERIFSTFFQLFRNFGFLMIYWCAHVTWVRNSWHFLRVSFSIHFCDFRECGLDTLTSNTRKSTCRTRKQLRTCRGFRSVFISQLHPKFHHKNNQQCLYKHKQFNP